MKPIRIGDAVGDYRVLDIAGSGGMGAVYKIEHTITRRIEAMKLLPPGSCDDPEQVHRFEREIQVQARLHHPNIVGLYTAVRDGSSIALVMEFVEGESLQHMLEPGPLPVETAVDFTTQVLRALAYAHEAGVIHRDVGPANIIVTPDRTAKLTDFGLARGATDLRLSTSGVPLGSPWYMSPEQVRGIVALDARTDLYAVGAVLHEMLTGGKLFAVEGAFALMRAHVEAEPRRPSSLNPKIPAAFDAIVAKAVAKDPAKRFQSADEFRLALQDVAVAADAPAEVPQNAPRPSQAGDFRLSRAAILMALVPGVLLAGFCTVRFFPAAPPARTVKSQPPAVAVSNREAVPVQPVASQAPETPAILPPAPPEVPVETEKPALRARPRSPLSNRATQRAGKAAPTYAIRVTGGEPVQPAADAPAPNVTPRQTTELPEPLVPKMDSGNMPDAVTQSAETLSDLTAGPPDAAPEKPRNGGNRFVKALGKVNPFRRRTPAKKD